MPCARLQQSDPPLGQPRQTAYGAGVLRCAEEPELIDETRLHDY